MDKKKVTFKSNITSDNMMGFINLDDKNYMPVNGFTTVDLGCERGNNAYNMVQKTEVPFSTAYIELFNSLWNDNSKMQVVTDEVVDNITAAYQENSPDFIYFLTLYNIFNEFLEDVSEDVLPNEATGFKSSKIRSMLYNFQKDAALAIINKLEKYNGCILADSVGLGKTFTALSVIKYYENRNKSVLVLCPKKLANNWKKYAFTQSFREHSRFLLLLETTLRTGPSLSMRVRLNTFSLLLKKGTMESLELRPIEQAKISCAKKLFNEMSTSKVKYHDVDSYQSLLNIMNTTINNNPIAPKKN